jgi:pyrimidine deaminase RibD-like protein
MSFMDKWDIGFMKEAISWANRCQPVKESIPKVGAIIAVGQEAIGRGRRGTGQQGDDEHAEWDALNKVKNKSLLAEATLYTTLEPCTQEVRSEPLECCTELIRQHQIKRVFIGMLDPNQGVTGKGLWHLQNAGVEVALFPHDLSKEIRIQNAAFIRSQQTLGATIISPKDGDELRTYETGGKHPIRFKCLNPPGDNTYLLIYQNGQCWPQPGPFRQVEDRAWEVDAHFGSTGEYFLQMVTANGLGDALVRYYRKVVDHNRGRRERLRGKVDLSLLGGDFPGIEMNGLPKGLRLEAFVKITVAYKVDVISASVDPKTISRGKTLKIKYLVESSENASDKIWLGASFQDNKTEKYFFNTREDKLVSLMKGGHEYERDFTIPTDAPSGAQMLRVNVWRGVVGDSSQSKCIARGTPVEIVIVP